MIEQVLKAIKRYKMLSDVSEVTVALSGGADSMALLHIMCELREIFGYGLSCAHLNHCLRGDDSDRDEQIVRDTCQRLDIPLFCEKADINCYAAQNKQSIELAARNVRYDFLKKVSKGVIATAHTASDNIETVIFNEVRGTSIRGLCGIPPVRDNIIRPLIFCTREMIEEYCNEHNIQYCIDLTNNDVNFTRNKIRKQIVPVLKEINSGAEQNFATMCDNLRCDMQFLDDMADDEYQKIADLSVISIDKIATLPYSILSRIILRYYEMHVGKSPDNLHIREICELCKRGNGSISIEKGLFACCENGLLQIRKKPETSESFCMEAENCPFIKIKTLEIAKINNLLLNQAIDCDKITGKLIVRSRQAGDCLSISERGVTKTLKKLFNEAAVPPQKRNEVLVLCDDKGVLWVEGFGTDKRANVDDMTKKALIVERIL